LAVKGQSQAERDGDRIYALVRAVGIASDGRAMGLLAPRVEGEELSMRRAYETAAVPPASVELLEAHGTGTPVGDATEIEALRRVFGPGNGRPRCALGSVKSMVGHSIPAAGSAGLIKAALALHDRALPPTLHVNGGNPKLEGTPFYLNSEAQPWIHDHRTPRRAAVSAFGFGGINAHAVLEEHV
jgi:acyl transferase domain-containing protein